VAQPQDLIARDVWATVAKLAELGLVSEVRKPVRA
jgi:hypothetical protein